MKTHWKKLKNPNYIGAYELMDGTDNPELIVTIDKVIKESVKGSDGKSEECTVAYLVDQKPMILNTVNSKAIESIVQSPFIEDWKGFSVMLFVKRVKAFGDWVDALRIKDAPQKLSLVQGSETWVKAVKYLKEGNDISAIAKKYELSEVEQDKMIEDANRV
jgi:hypothetical protein